MTYAILITAIIGLAMIVHAQDARIAMLAKKAEAQDVVNAEVAKMLASMCELHREHAIAEARRLRVAVPAGVDDWGLVS